MVIIAANIKYIAGANLLSKVLIKYIEVIGTIPPKNPYATLKARENEVYLVLTGNKLIKKPGRAPAFNVVRSDRITIPAII